MALMSETYYFFPEASSPPLSFQDLNTGRPFSSFSADRSAEFSLPFPSSQAAMPASSSSTATEAVYHLTAVVAQIVGTSASSEALGEHVVAHCLVPSHYLAAEMNTPDPRNPNAVYG